MMTAKDECVFCRIIKKEIPAKISYEDDQIIAFEDIKGQAPIHIIVIPRMHIEKVSDLKDNDAGLVGRMVLAAKDIAKNKRIEESGYRLVMNCNRDAGQKVFHLHMHLLGGRPMNWPPG